MARPLVSPHHTQHTSRPFPLALAGVLCGIAFGLPAPSATATSIGAVEDGRLRNARAVSASGEHHYILPRRHRARGLRYGTPELVELVMEAAATVAQKLPGSRLGLGNMSRRRGGRIRYSHSHQSGRDADLAFYMTNAKGRPVAPRDLVRFDKNGRGRSGLRFDTPRMWALVAALLTSQKASVQWLLISRPLRQRLLDHGREAGASDELLRRASDALHQPRWALPHDDHLHVRIYCPPADVPKGCRDTGPRWPWANIATPPPGRDADDEEG